jgi:penicillin-binding protein 1A
MYRMMQGVVDFGTGHGMRDKFGIKSEMGGKTGTTNENTDGWFIGYTPQLLAGVWVGCDDPFLRIKQTYGGNEMAMPEFAYFMQKVYADKSLGIDPKAEFEKPAELDNNPIYADQNFSSIVNQGQGDDNSDDHGNGNENDYAPVTDVPVESDFGKDNNKPVEATKKPEKDTIHKAIMPPVNLKKEPVQKDAKKESQAKIEIREPAKKPVKNKTDY